MLFEIGKNLKTANVIQKGLVGRKDKARMNYGNNGGREINTLYRAELFSTPSYNLSKTLFFSAAKIPKSGKWQRPDTLSLRSSLVSHLWASTATVLSSASVSLQPPVSEAAEGKVALFCMPQVNI